MAENVALDLSVPQLPSPWEKKSIVLAFHARMLNDFWSLWCLDMTVEREAVYLMASCWLNVGEEGLGGSLLAEDPLPHLEPRRFTQG